MKRMKRLGWMMETTALDCSQVCHLEIPSECGAQKEEGGSTMSQRSQEFDPTSVLSPIRKVERLTPHPILHCGRHPTVWPASPVSGTAVPN